MAELSFSITGADPDAAARALVDALDGGDGTAVTTAPDTTRAEGERRVIDPISLATLIVSVPAAVLAVWDLVDRIRKKRPKAQQVVETARRLRAEQQVEVYLLTAEQTQQAVADLDADRLLDLVAAIEPQKR